MSSLYKFTYVLYLIDGYNMEKAIFLGVCHNPIKLYYDSLNIENIINKNRPILSKWLNLVEENLDANEIKDLEYAFMYNPETEFSYPIKDMELVIKKVKQL